MLAQTTNHLGHYRPKQHTASSMGEEPRNTLACQLRSQASSPSSRYSYVLIRNPDMQKINSTQPQRCMIYVKETYPQAKFEAAFAELWVTMWQEGLDLSKPDLMAKALSRHFPDEEVKTVLEQANTPAFKQKLLDNTKVALDRGAFGCPWFWVENSKGEKEPFFGSDR